MFRKVFVFHVLPFVIASFLVYVLVSMTYLLHGKAKMNQIELGGSQIKTKGNYLNYARGNQAELDFVASLQNESQLTIMGSSELSDSPYCSHNFLPDSLGLQAVSFGHAFHQEFSMFCEFLAANEHLENSKICILLSPGWFDSEGTNTEAFVEFVPQNFLQKIAFDESIEPMYKYEVGKYIFEHEDEIEGASHAMNTLRDYYSLCSTNFGEKFIANIRMYVKEPLGFRFNTDFNKYSPKLSISKNNRMPVHNKNEYLIELQGQFITSITNNKIFVYNEYYEKYVLDKNKVEQHGSIGKKDLANNRELKDFKLLVKYLSEKSANCSFIIQPLNPYYYKNLDDNIPLINELTKVLKKNNIPFLNLYASDKKEYEPGTLNDIMHLGDYGWMKINYFLDSLYNEK